MPVRFEAAVAACPLNDEAPRKLRAVLYSAYAPNRNAFLIGNDFRRLVRDGDSDKRVG